MKNLKEFFENISIRMLIQDTLSLRSGKKTSYEVAEEIAKMFVNCYGHMEFKDWSHNQPTAAQQPKQPILSANDRHLIVSVGFEEILKSQTFEIIIKEILQRSKGIRVELLSGMIINELIREYCFNNVKQKTEPRASEWGIPKLPDVEPMFKTPVKEKLDTITLPNAKELTDNANKMLFEGSLKAGVTLKAGILFTDSYKEQKDNVQKAIDNLQRELEKATRMHMVITLKGCNYPKELITIESATREI